MKRVFLGGTTTRTTWRAELTARMIERGVLTEQIVNPHLPSGVSYTHAHMLAERNCKRDPDTIVLVYVRPAIVDGTGMSSKAILQKSERLGPISMFEIGKFAYSEPHRTAIVLDYKRFSKKGRPRKVMKGLANELRDDFGGKPPYFPSLGAAEDWIVSQLLEPETPIKRHEALLLS